MSIMKLLIIMAPLAIGTAKAEETMHPIQVRMEQLSTTVVGSTEPHRVLYEEKMSVFFRNYEEIHSDRIGLSEPDDSLLKAFIAEDAKAREAADAVERREIKKLRAAATDMSAPDIFAAIDERTKAFMASQVARWKAGVERLSASGQKTVSEYVGAKVVPTMALRRLDEGSLWSEFPEEMKAAFLNPPSKEQRDAQIAAIQAGGGTAEASGEDDFGIIDE